YSQIIKDFGIKIGGTVTHQNWDYSKLGFDPGFDPNNKLGLNLGIFAESSDLSIFKIVGELNFIQKGVEE
ncbi:MAG: hypothetical protein WAR79_05560, partial [Melioribacteraceae bacterium]